MNKAEKVAIGVVQTVIRGAKMVFHDEGMTGAYDFDLVLPTGDCYPLEVTSVTDKRARATTAAILDKRKGAQCVQGRDCKCSWYVQPVATAKINDIRERVDQYLAALEEEGIERFFSPFEVQSAAIKAIYHDLGVAAAWRIKVQQPPQIRIGLPNKEAMLGDGTPATEAALVEAWKKDNRSKLAQVTASRLHLFVYIDHSSFAAWFAMNHFEAPHSIALLPPEITDIWVVAQRQFPDIFIVWKSKAQNPWENKGSIQVSMG